MRERIREIAESIARLDDQRKTIAEGMRERKIDVLPDALERGMIHLVEPKPLSLKVAAVDGGILAQEFHGFDLLMTRAVAVMFTYSGSKLASNAYYPSALPDSDIEVTYTMDTHEFQRFKSLFRLRKEILTAVEACEKFSPDYMLLDGSIVPQISDKPGADEKEPRALYSEIIALYSRLYALCEAKGIQLVGIIKDSRGRRFIEILEKMLVEGERETMRCSNDTTLLNFMLRQNERTAAFSYSTSEKEHVVLKDLGEWGKRICAFYAKPAPDDRPLRVEFLQTANASADGIAAMACELSCINSKYAYPAVLIEADLRAAMDPLELDRTYKDLFVRTGLRSAMMKLRRDSRPFR
jgi:hypothetical protein